MSNISVSKIKLPNDNNNYIIKDGNAKTAIYSASFSDTILSGNAWYYNSTLGKYIQVINLFSSYGINLKCGSDGNTPPIVSSDSTEWDKIETITFDSSANTMTGIAVEQPTSIINIKILDFLA